MGRNGSWRVERLFSRGQRLAGRDDFDAALAVYDEALKKAPDYARLHLWRGVALAETGRFEKAVEAVRKAAELEPRNAVFPQFLARIHYDHEDFDAARHAVAASLELDPRNPQGLGLGDLVAIRCGEIDDGVAAIEERVATLGDELQARLLAWCVGFLSDQEEHPGEGTAKRKGGSDQDPVAEWHRTLAAEIEWVATTVRVHARSVAKESSDEEGLPQLPSVTNADAAAGAGYYGRYLALFPGLVTFRAALGEYLMETAVRDHRLVTTAGKPPAPLPVVEGSLTYFGLLLRAVGRGGQARACWQRAIEKSERAYVARFLLADQLRVDGEAMAANREFARALRYTIRPLASECLSLVKEIRRELTASSGK